LIPPGHTHKENVMHPTLRAAGALVGAVLALMPSGSARAMHLPADHAVLLPYHFVPDQTYAYRMAMNMRMSMSTAGAPASGSPGTVTVSSTVHFHILRVDASGGANAEISVSKATMSTTTGGRTT